MMDYISRDKLANRISSVIAEHINGLGKYTVMKASDDIYSWRYEARSTRLARIALAHAGRADGVAELAKLIDDTVKAYYAEQA